MATPVITNIDNVNHTYTADGQNYALNPNTNRFELASSIPTKAPSVASTQTPSSASTQAPKVTAPVVSSNTAANLVNNKIVPTMNNANTQISTAAQAVKDKAAADALAASKKPITTPITPLTPEQQIASQPDAGNQWIYDKATGQQTQVPVGSTIPQTHTTVDVKSAPAVDTTYSTDGNITFKKLSDGTYGKYDTNSGQYLGASSENQFSTMKAGATAKTAYENAITNGALLNDSQKAQIQSISDTYQRLLTDQQNFNNNYTGGTAVLQNLYGIGNSMIGQGAIKSAVDEGVAKIADINSKMNSDIAKMTAAFQSDNIAVLKDAYDSYSRNSSSLQAAIDAQHQEAVQLERDQKQQTATMVQQIDNDIRGLQNAMMQTVGVTASQRQAMQKALENHDYNAAFAAVGNSLQKADGWMGRYLDYSRAMDQINPGAPKMDPIDYKNWEDNDKITAAQAGQGGPSASAGAGNAPFQGTINNILGTISNGKEYDREAERLGQLATNGDWDGLMQALKTRAKTSQVLTAADKTDLVKAEKQIPSLDRMKSALLEYQKQGGNMNYLKGKEKDISTRLGELATDPKYQAIATELDAAFQQYRMDMTGAAFGAAESAEYGSVLPGKNKNFDLNYAVIDGLKNYMEGKVDDTYTSALGEGYMNLKSQVEARKNNDPVQKERRATDAFNSWKTQNPTKVKEALDLGAGLEKTLGRPITDSEFLEAYPQYGGGQSFNSVGNDTKKVSVVIPKTSSLAYKNNNPGNLRFVGQAGASDGYGGFAKFPTPEAGVQALANQIKLDTSRGHTLASFINKYAPPNENDTNQYLSSIMKMVGVGKNTPLAQINQDKLLKAIALQESSTKIT